MKNETRVESNQAQVKPSSVKSSERENGREKVPLYTHGCACMLFFLPIPVPSCDQLIYATYSDGGYLGVWMGHFKFWRFPGQNLSLARLEK